MQTSLIVPIDDPTITNELIRQEIVKFCQKNGWRLNEPKPFRIADSEFGQQVIVIATMYVQCIDAPLHRLQITVEGIPGPKTAFFQIKPVKKSSKFIINKDNASLDDRDEQLTHILLALLRR